MNNITTRVFPQVTADLDANKVKLLLTEERDSSRKHTIIVEMKDLTNRTWFYATVEGTGEKVLIMDKGSP